MLPMTVNWDCIPVILKMNSFLFLFFGLGV